MKKLLLLLFAVMLLPFAFSSAQAENEQLIIVNGTGKVVLEPDIVRIDVGISSEKDTVQEALDDNTSKVEAVKDALTDLGVAEEDIKTSNYSLYSSQKYYRDSTASLDEYIFSVYYGFSIILRDTTLLNDALDACIRNGANSIGGVTYDSTHREDVKREARDLAIDDATSKANEIADKLGVTIEHVESIKSLDSLDQMYSYGAGMGGFGGGGGTAPISSGNLEIPVTVEMSFYYGLD